MPIDPGTGIFARIWKFVDQFAAGDDIDRSALDAALDDLTPAINEALDAKIAAEAAVAYSGRGFATRADLLADDTLTYTTGQAGTVAVGDIIQVYATGDAYAVLASGASGPDATTAGGVKLEYQSPTIKPVNAIVFQSLSALLADTTLTYSAGPSGPVDPGAMILALADLSVYEVLASGAGSYDEITAGGLKLAAGATPFNPSLYLTKAGNLSGLADATTALTGPLGFSAFMTGLRATASAAALRTAIGAQESDAALTSLAGLSLAAGDLLYATAADTLVRLPKGYAGQALLMNSGATAPEWGAPPIGVNQTWSNVAGSRVGGTSYQNTTGRPIQVAIEGSGSGSRLVQVSADNATWVTLSDINRGGQGWTAFFIVPASWYYRVNTSGGTIDFWSELS